MVRVGQGFARGCVGGGGRGLLQAQPTRQHNKTNKNKTNKNKSNNHAETNMETKIGGGAIYK